MVDASWSYGGNFTLKTGDAALNIDIPIDPVDIVTPINDKLVIVGSTFDRIKRFYRGNAGGECIAAGNQQAEKTFQQWLNSDGHAKILLEHDSRVVGIGFVQVEGSPHEYYWVLATGN
mgnify:CR=1 FL=1